MSSELLARAGTALDRGRPDEARAALLQAWRDRRAGDLARLVELLDGRWPDGLRARLAAVVGPRVDGSLRRFEALASLDDPRVSGFALDSLTELPFTSRSAQSFLEHLIDTAARRVDQRLSERSTAISQALSGRLTSKPMRDALLARLVAAQRQVQSTPPRPPDAEESDLVAALTHRLSSGREDVEAGEQLLATVYRTPADDPARLVYGDWLLQRGDPRGEFLGLQYQRARGQLDAAGERRETELLRRHGKAWLGRLAAVVAFGKAYSRTTFERGFLSVVTLVGSPEKKLQLVLQDPAWSTVEEFASPLPFDLLARAPLRSLRGLSCRDVLSLRTLAARPEPLRSVETVRFGDAQLLHHGDLRKAFPHLLRASVTFDDPEPADVARVARAHVSTVEVSRAPAGSTPALDYEQRRFRLLLPALEGLPATIEKLSLVPPYLGPVAPPPVEFHTRDLRLVRVAPT